MQKKILLIDASHLLFRAFFAFPKNLKDREGKVINAVFGVAQMLFTVLEKEKPDYVFAAKDLNKKTLRSEKFPEYKAHRPPLDEDLRNQIPRIYDFFDAFSIPVFSEEGHEADDFLASIGEKFRGNYEYQVEILTGDADALQLIGENVFVLIPSKGENTQLNREKLFEKKELYPDEIIDFKGLAGDNSDNLKGVEGIGEKGAKTLIREFGNLEKIYAALEAGKIKGAKVNKLTQGKENAFFTREMATLNRSLNLTNFCLEDGDIYNFSPEKLQNFFIDLGSNTLQKRMQNFIKIKQIKATPEENNLQISLF